jgi:hypothetical protein
MSWPALGLTILITLALCGSLWASASANPPLRASDEPRPGTNPAAAVRAVRHTLDAVDRYVPLGSGTPDYASIQAAIAASGPGDVIHIAAGSYYEDILIDRSVTLDGAGQGLTVIYPAGSDVGICPDATHPTLGNTQVMVVNAHDVVISNLAIDGDSPANGVGLDARNGIIEGNGPWNNLTVHDVTVTNIWLRAIYARSGGSGFNIHHCTVSNVTGCNQSIAIFNFGGAGIIANNTVSNVNDAIVSNWSRGTQFLNNTVTQSAGYGIHSDNNGGYGGSPDLIQGNNVSNPLPGGWGIMIFFPYLNAVATNNSVTGAVVDLFAWGTSGGTAIFTDNTVSGAGASGDIGLYATTGWPTIWVANVNAQFSGNTVSGCDYGFFAESYPGYTATITTDVTPGGSVADVVVSGLGTLAQTGLAAATVEVDAPGFIQQGIGLATVGGTVHVMAGLYAEDILVNKAVTVSGAGIDVSTIRGLKTGANSATVRMAAVGSVIEGFTITRDGNNVTDWAANVKSAGVAIQSTGGATVRNNKLTGNRTAIDINNAGNVQVLNNVIDFNRTGIVFRNPSLNTTVEQNQITNNWTVGIVWLGDGGLGENTTGTRYFNNNISGNWYGQIENRSTGTFLKDFSGNWLGTSAPTTTSANGGEPGYTSQIPLEFGGSASNPGGAITVKGVGLAYMDYTPWLNSGTDTDLLAAGFQGDFSNLWVSAASAQSGATGRIREGIDLTSGSVVNVAAGIYNEAVVVNKSVTLLGAQAGILARTRSGAESIVDPNSTAAHGFAVHAGQVTIDGFTITNSAAYTSGERYGVVAIEKIGGGQFSNVAVRNNVISHQFKAVDFNNSDNFEISGNWLHGENAAYNYGCLWVDDYGTSCNTGLITNNDLDGYSSVVEIQGDLTHPVSNVTISNNRSTHGQYVLFGLQNSSITGNSVLNVTTGTHVYVGGGCTNVTVTDNHFDTGSANGMSFNDQFGAGTNSDFVIHNNSFTGHTGAGFYEMKVNTPGYTGVVNAECNWWGTLNSATIASKIFNPAQVDYENWNDASLTACIYNDANTYDFTLSFDDPYVGCTGGASCTDAVLRVAFDRAQYIGGHLIISLPAGIVANWTGNQYQTMPSSNRSTNLNFINAAGGGTGTITLDVSWQPPYSTGTPGQYIALLPVRNNGATDGAYNVTVSGTDFWDAAGHHTSGFDFSLPSLTVDCTAPVGTALTGGAGEGTCAGYNDAAAFTNALSAVVGASISSLSSAVISLNGGAHTYNVPLADGAWPLTADAATVWGHMTEGCNTFALTVTDATCNSTTTADVSVIKDTQAPVFTPPVYFTQAAPCYNKIADDPNNGAARLNTELNMTVDAPAACQTGGFTLTFTMGANSLVPISGAAITGYPDATQAANLWTFILANVAPDYSGSVTVNWSLKDCLGNETAGSFAFCVDFAPPANSFTTFDARPTSDGVWLKWAWGTTDAVEAKIFRKGEGDYPVYAGAFWRTDVNDSHYAKNFATDLAGWTLVATLTGGVNSTDFGTPAQHAPGHPDYWKDAVTARDIYRYVTFVKDATGNWSQVASYTIGANADRSTNYWLGDFSPDPASAGIVNGSDLSELSMYYFQTVSAASQHVNIGPENHENGMGKGIPSPDGVIDFNDLVPFSFNFGVVASGGYLVTPPPAKPFASLSAMPVVNLARTSDGEITANSTFTVAVSLTGNDHSVKAVESIVKFDPQVLELVSVTPASFDAADGLPWTTARAVTGQPGKVVVAAAAMGQTATIAGEASLAVIEFRWKSTRVAMANISLESVKISDAGGVAITGSGSTLGIGAQGILPTAYALFQNYPNPFNPTTTIAFDLKDNGFVRLNVYNLLGQSVATLVNTSMEAGHHTVSFDASGLSSGLYIYKIEVNGYSALHKMLLTR